MSGNRPIHNWRFLHNSGSLLFSSLTNVVIVVRDRYPAAEAHVDSERTYWTLGHDEFGEVVCAEAMPSKDGSRWYVRFNMLIGQL